MKLVDLSAKKLLRHSLPLMLCLSLGSTALAFDTAQDSGLLLLVNKSHSVSADYVPALVSLTGLSEPSCTMELRQEAADAYRVMYADMLAQGIEKCDVIDGYRSYDTQQGIVNRKVNQKMASGMSWQSAYNQVTTSTAPAGSSEHQLGLAIDLSVLSHTTSSFANTPAGAWMRENSWKYGYILRYQSGKMNHTKIINEPWHYRYIGIPHAQILYENNWCYEEYINYLHENGSYTLTTENETYTIYWTQDTTAEYTGIRDISSDNAGGWIITTAHVHDPLTHVRGHWSESLFVALQEYGIVIPKKVIPGESISAGDFAQLCGLAPSGDSKALITRARCTQLLEDALPNKTLSYLKYADCEQISGAVFQSVQMAVSNGIFTHETGALFRPNDNLTWAEAGAVALRFLQATR